MWRAGQFEPTIHYLRFPRFKNFAENMRIDFTHPVTALVGPNGSSKTTILRVLQAAPGGRDLGNYWFGTAVDHILSKDRHRFIYGRHSDSTGRDVEVIKTRIARRDEVTGQVNPDLFEPSRPLTGPPDNMDKYEYGDDPPADGLTTRWKTLSKRVSYIDFRTQISAFDWAFHQAEADSTTSTDSEIQKLRKRKARIRRRSHRLNVAIAQELRSDVWNRKERIVNRIRPVKVDEKRWIETILDREYDSIRVMRHRYFRRDGGVTVLMQHTGTEYSEAFAGSGEFATVKLVITVMRAPEKSLILLDEPEVSLHPAAQRKAMEFLCAIAQSRKHQIVLATHSPDMIGDLPPEAVKVLEIRSDNAKVDVPAQRAAPQLAFEAVGARYEHPAVVVEDELAVAIVERAISGESFSKVVTIRAIPGGASSLLTHRVPMWATDGTSNLLLLLDGDQRSPSPREDGSIPEDELESEAKEAFGGCLPKLSYGSTETGAADEREEELRRALNWRRQHVDFLPFEKPEAYIWDFRINPDIVPATGDPKKDWVAYATAELSLKRPRSIEILTLQRQAIMRIPYASSDLAKIRSTIANFLDSSGSEN
ncbi:AAA family ATPase [soil metagenome]